MEAGAALEARQSFKRQLAVSPRGKAKMKRRTFPRMQLRKTCRTRRNRNRKIKITAEARPERDAPERPLHRRDGVKRRDDDGEAGISYVHISIGLKSPLDPRTIETMIKQGAGISLRAKELENPAAAPAQSPACHLRPLRLSLRRLVHKSRGFTIPVKKGNAIFIVISCSYI
jgi:hypothetical protein